MMLVIPYISSIKAISKTLQLLNWLKQNEKMNKTYNPKTFKQIARDNMNLDDKVLDKELA